MFDQMAFRWKLWNLQRRMSRTSEFYKIKIADARREKRGNDEIDAIQSEESFEIQWMQDEIANLATKHFFQKAYKYLIPQPNFDEEGMWIKSDISGRRLLTEKGIVALRSAIRKEQKEASEIYLTWLAGLTGLVGALTGLVALLGK